MWFLQISVSLPSSFSSSLFFVLQSFLLLLLLVFFFSFCRLVFSLMKFAMIISVMLFVVLLFCASALLRLGRRQLFYKTKCDKMVAMVLILMWLRATLLCRAKRLNRSTYTTMFLHSNTRTQIRLHSLNAWHNKASTHVYTTFVLHKQAFTQLNCCTLPAFT